MRVYLTGGTGLVGSHVAERLRARGDEVVCLVRDEGAAGHLAELGCRLLPGNVRDEPAALATGMRGCDAVVHAAALVYPGAPWPRIRPVNVEGAAHVAAAAQAAEVPRFVHISSIAVYGPRRSGEPVDEDAAVDAPLPPADLYARSKREAESAVRDGLRRTGTRLVVLRPAAVYGERDRLLSPRIASLASWPVVPLLGSGTNTVPVVYAGNVASAVEEAFGAEDGATYNVANDHPLTQRELVSGILEALGRTPRFLRLPATFVEGAAKMGEALGLGVPGAGDLPLSRMARLSLEDNPYRSQRIRRDLAWVPPFTHEVGLARTGRWLADRG